MDVHVISSPLLRTNGITEYIRALLSDSAGHVVTDSKPGEYFDFTIMYLNETSNYDPTRPNDHPWLYWDEKIVENLIDLLKRNKNTYPKNVRFFSHDAKAEKALQTLGWHSWFVQHEADVLNQTRYSYLSDEWLAEHHRLLENSCALGLRPLGDHIRCRSKGQLPYPVQFDQKEQTEIINDVILIADASHRKGWDIYFDWWQNNGKPSTSVMSREIHPDWPRSWVVRSFDHNDTDAKLQFIRNHKVAAIPSRSEGAPIALEEARSQIPTALDLSWQWTIGYEGIYALDDIPKFLK